nr:MAG TPA: hypothetical protein [Caudoviricetes sp.]
MRRLVGACSTSWLTSLYIIHIYAIGVLVKNIFKNF